MPLNQRLAEAVLVSAVPEAGQFFAPGEPHLDATKWTVALKQLEVSMRRKVASTAVYTVVAKNVSAPNAGGDKHHFYSLAPYYWPNPSTPDGLQYIYRDGLINPESDAIGDQQQLTHMASDVYQLAISWFLLGDEIYAERAMELLDAWDYNERTRMYPSVEHGQVRKGYQDDRGQPTALIEFVKHVQIIDALVMLNSSVQQRARETAASTRRL
jgi:hypothetical protein